MSLNGISARTPIDGWVILIAEGKQLIGLPSHGIQSGLVPREPLGSVPFDLEPAWAYALMQAQTPDGQVGVVVRLEPVMRLLSVKKLHIHRALVVAEVDSLSRHERVAILQAYEVLQREIVAVSAEQAGITVAGSIPKSMGRTRQ
jgi:hypothetical protein